MDPYDSSGRNGSLRLPAFLPWFVALVCVAAVAWMSFRIRPMRLHDPDARPRIVTPRGDLSDAEQATIAIYKGASASVVHIENLAMRRDVWSLDVTEMPQGTGSGFIWDAQGRIVTNAHVVKGGDAFHVTLADRTTWPARLVGAEFDSDVAVLQIDDAPPEKFLPLAVGTSSDLKVGQSVLAIGNPFGLDQTLTTGVISGLGREMRALTGRRIRDVIQIDAAINPGNSGGPLLDSAGRLVGMNTAIFSPSGTSAGIGFAVPVDSINRVVPRIIRGEKPERAGMGITLIPDSYFAGRGLRGAVILNVQDAGPAERAGLRPTRRDLRTGRVLLGDVIIAIDGRPVRNQQDLLDLLDEHAIGDRIQVTVARGEGREDVPVVLGAVESE